MIANDVIDFFMEQLLLPEACAKTIRQSIKAFANMSRGPSLGRRMLTDQLIDVLFDLYTYELSTAAELGAALKAKLNRYGHSHFMPVRQAAVILPLRKGIRAVGC